MSEFVRVGDPEEMRRIAKVLAARADQLARDARDMPATKLTADEFDGPAAQRMHREAEGIAQGLLGSASELEGIARSLVADAARVEELNTAARRLAEARGATPPAPAAAPEAAPPPPEKEPPA